MTILSNFPGFTYILQNFSLKQTILSQFSNASVRISPKSTQNINMCFCLIRKSLTVIPRLLKPMSPAEYVSFLMDQTSMRQVVQETSIRSEFDPQVHNQ